MHVLWLKGKKESAYSVFLKCSSHFILLNGEIPARGMSVLNFITARRIYLHDKRQTEIRFNQIYYNERRYVRPIQWPPSYPAILPNHSLEEMSGILGMRRSTDLYFFLNSFFGEPPNIQDVEEIYNALNIINLGSQDYKVDSYMLPIYISGRNPVITFPEEIHVRLLGKHTLIYTSELYFRDPPPTNNDLGKIKKDIEKTICGNHIIIYSDNICIKYSCEKEPNHLSVRIREKSIFIRGECVFNSFYPIQLNPGETIQHYYGISGYLSESLTDITYTLFTLTVIDILKNHNKVLYSNIVFKNGPSFLKLIHGKITKLYNLTPVFHLYNSYKNRVTGFFMLSLYFEKIWHNEKNDSYSTLLNIYFIGEVRILHDYFKRLKEEKLVQVVTNLLLQNKFETISNDLKHYMFFEVDNTRIKQYVFATRQNDN